MNRICTRGALLISVLALGGAAAGCSDDETKTVTRTVSEKTSSADDSSTTNETSTAETAETTTADTTVEGGEGSGGIAPPDQEVKDLTGFSSPSTNIGCIIDRGSVRCDVRDPEWNPPARPASCNDNVDYGQGITLSAGAAPEFVCAGDTTLDAGPVLAYGESIAAGLLRCDSEETGMTCRDTETGRGFKISIQAYKLF